MLAALSFVAPLLLCYVSVKLLSIEEALLRTITFSCAAFADPSGFRFRPHSLGARMPSALPTLWMVLDVFLVETDAVKKSQW